jgi:hypothetical protein
MDGSPVIKLKSTSQNSEATGLIVEVFAGNSYNTASMQSGVHVFMGNNTVRINSLLGFTAPTAAYTYVAIQKTVTETLSKPYSDCVEDVTSINGYNSDLFRTLILANYSYNQENCYNLYVQRNIIDKCGCYYTVFMNIDNHPTACVGIENFKCLINANRILYADDYKSKIQDICPLECVDYGYSYTLHSTR